MPTLETDSGPVVSTPPAGGECIQISQDKAHTRVTLAGALDLTAVETLHATLTDLVDSGKDVIIDCVNAEHVSCAALQVILGAEAALAEKQHRLRIEGESPAIRDYLRLAGLEERLPASKSAASGKRKRSSQVSPQP